MNGVAGHTPHFEWDPETVAAVRAALDVVAETYELSASVKSALAGEPSDHLKAFIRALDYHALRPTGRPQSPDDLYGPMFTTTAGDSYPEPLETASRDTVLAWADASQLFGGNDVVSARLHDLLWLRRSGPRPDLHAREAQAAMRRLWSQRELASVHRGDWLVRALEIAEELSDPILVSATATELVVAVRETLEGEEWAPGVAIPMLEALAALPKKGAPEEIGALIAASKRRYADDPFILESLLLLEMQRAGGDQAIRRGIAREAVEMWRDHAEQRGGLVGLAHIERALELARNEGLTNVADELRALLQQPRSADELGMKRVSGEVKVPAETIERFIGAFTATSGANETLARLANHIPITDVDSDAQMVREQMREHPLLNLASRVLTDADGTPLAHISTDDQKFDYALNQHHALAITIWGSLLGMIIERLAANNTVEAADIKQFIVGDFIDDAAAETVASAYQDLQDGDYEAALLRLLPQIERATRLACRTLGLIVFREASLDGKSLGAYKGLGELLRLLAGRMPENQRRYLAVLLTERTGINLRNRAAHGLMDAVAPAEASLGFHALLVISTWRAGPPHGAGQEV